MYRHFSLGKNFFLLKYWLFLEGIFFQKFSKSVWKWNWTIRVFLVVVFFIWFFQIDPVLHFPWSRKISNKVACMRCVRQRARRSPLFPIRSRVIQSGPGAEVMLEDLMACLTCFLPKKTTVSDNIWFHNFIYLFFYFSFKVWTFEVIIYSFSNMIVC